MDGMNNSFQNNQNLQILIINPTKQIEDTIDLTKQHHNLLQRKEGSGDTSNNLNVTTSYTWDSNVLHAVGSGVRERTEETDVTTYNTYQYLQDELGSPIRVLGEEGIEETYGYDEFGVETINSHNQEQGQSQTSLNFTQPFMYTGYQKDNIANTYYAQAREYTPGVGRFSGEDVIKGNVVQPFTMNQYVYCGSSPMSWVDLDGRDRAATELAKWLQDNSLPQKTFGDFALEKAEEHAQGMATLTETEKELIKSHPIQAYVVQQCQIKADVWTEKEFSEYYEGGSWQDGDAANAYRHAMWNALLVRSLGVKNAKKWADAHEAWPEIDANTKMDLHNNQIGRDIAEKTNRIPKVSLSERAISKLLLEELRKGNMDILIDDGWYDEVMECDG